MTDQIEVLAQEFKKQVDHVKGIAEEFKGKAEHNDKSLKLQNKLLMKQLQS